MALHLLCDFEALARLKLMHLGQQCINPGDFEDISVSRTLHSVQGVGLLNTLAWGLHKNTDNEVPK
jgi:hypothetical protein